MMNMTMKIELEDLLKAWYECRKSKRHSKAAVDFEINAEANLVALYEEIKEGRYRVSPSEAFIVTEPVKREIFAASFRDRVVHHFLATRINPLFEREFIYDSYACRVGRGALFGVKRLRRFIAQGSANYTRDCYVLQCDIRGFFMNIDRQLLADRLDAFLREKYTADDRETVLYLTRLIALDNPVAHVRIKGCPRLWKGLPRDKSLFSLNGMPLPCDKQARQLELFDSNRGCGLPIGNLTSQLFANFYLNKFDHYCKSVLKLRYYGRYVDDFFVVHPDKDYLKSLVPVFQQYLRDELHLILHPAKIRLTRCAYGICFLGTQVKGRVIRTGKRTVKGLRRVIGLYNDKVSRRPLTGEEEERFMQSYNSYIGLMRHHSSFLLRCSARQWMFPALEKLFFITDEKILRRSKVMLKRHLAIRRECKHILHEQKKAGLVPGDYDRLYAGLYALRYHCPEILNHGFTHGNTPLPANGGID